MNGTMSNGRTWMSDLERELADDGDGRILSERKKDFLKYSHDLSRAMEKGMSKEDLHKAMDMKRAAEAAVNILEILWRRLRS